MDDQKPRRPPPEIKPLTPDEQREWMCELEDIATEARNDVAALEFLFCNLFVELARNGTVEGDRFIAYLRDRTKGLDHPTGTAARRFLDSLRLQSADTAPPAPGGGPEVH